MEYSGRPERDEYAEFYAGYIAQVPAGDIVAILRSQIEDTVSLLRSDEALERAEYRYAPGKWSLKEVVGHIADAERVFAYRALRFARGDHTELPGFDENAYVTGGEFSLQSLDDLTANLVAVRAATVALLDQLPPDAWVRTGTANGKRISVRALVCIAAGHELHHRDGILRNYLERR